VDLSYLRFEHDASVAVLPPDLAVLLVGVAARQAASPTALAHTRFAPQVTDESIFSPPSGAFDAAVAARIFEWRQE
jgi:hypothetical protein